MFPDISFVHWLVILSALISLSGNLVYIRDTLAGRTKPNRVSWSLWAAAPIIATVAALSAHADGWATVRIFISGFTPLLVFAASFLNPNAYWKLGKFDFICGAVAVIGLILWGLADSPRLAILFLAIADGFACIPTLIKAWKHPETETGFAYITSFVAVLIVLPSIPVWNIENSAFQIYLLIANTALLFTVYRKKLTFGKQTS